MMEIAQSSYLFEDGAQVGSARVVRVEHKIPHSASRLVVRDTRDRVRVRIATFTPHTTLTLLLSILGTELSRACKISR